MKVARHCEELIIIMSVDYGYLYMILELRQAFNQSINHVLFPSHVRRSLWRAAIYVSLYLAWSLVSAFSCPVLLSELRLSNPIFLCFLWILPCVPLLFASRLAAHLASFFHPLICFALYSFAPCIVGILVGSVQPFPAHFGTRNWGCRLTRDKNILNFSLGVLASPPQLSIASRYCLGFALAQPQRLFLVVCSFVYISSWYFLAIDITYPLSIPSSYFIRLWARLALNISEFDKNLITRSINQ